PQDAVVIEASLLPLGARRRVPEERVVEADVHRIAAGDLHVVSQQGVRQVILEPVSLVGHERLMPGDDLFGRDEPRLLDLNLLLLRLEALDRHPGILQNQGTRVEGHRYAGRVALEVLFRAPARRPGRPAGDVVDRDAADRRGRDDKAPATLLHRRAREKSDQPLERLRIEEGIGRDTLEGAWLRTAGRLDHGAGSGP